ncbi:hypothetical protein BST12_26820 [Mycobacterium angelicum]|uniref:Uncharacterized protein n=1 Tax=Mycobacterium angelicum TaxID=470074 RepID=A0A1W9ZA08_MYCAN|nr:hypothetical protein BST12_26820 [Mycobacterium angelicum]
MGRAAPLAIAEYRASSSASMTCFEPTWPVPAISSEIFSANCMSLMISSTDARRPRIPITRGKNTTK